MTSVANGMALTRPDLPPLSITQPSVPEAKVPATEPPARHAPFLSREHILDATLACLLESGYDGTTIRRIAKHLGCAVGSIYRYFTDKRELLDAVTLRRFVPVAEAIEGGASLQNSFASYARTANEEPELYRLMFWLHSVGQTTTAKLPPVIDRIILAWANKLDDQRTAQRLWTLLHGGIMLGRGADFCIRDPDSPKTMDADPPILEPIIAQEINSAPVMT